MLNESESRSKLPLVSSARLGRLAERFHLWDTLVPAIGFVVGARVVGLGLQAQDATQVAVGSVYLGLYYLLDTRINRAKIFR